MITPYDEIHAIYMNQEDRTIAMWVRIRVELEPGGFLYRWWGEVSAQWVHPDGTPVKNEWHNYWQDEYHSMSLRRAWRKAEWVVSDLIERMNNDPGERPI